MTQVFEESKDCYYDNIDQQTWGDHHHVAETGTWDVHNVVLWLWFLAKGAFFFETSINMATELMSLKVKVACINLLGIAVLWDSANYVASGELKVIESVSIIISLLYILTFLLKKFLESKGLVYAHH
jgi:hypothetical protein